MVRQPHELGVKKDKGRKTGGKDQVSCGSQGARKKPNIQWPREEALRLRGAGRRDKAWLGRESQAVSLRERLKRTGRRED